MRANERTRDEQVSTRDRSPPGGIDVSPRSSRTSGGLDTFEWDCFEKSPLGVQGFRLSGHKRVANY